MNVRGLAWLGTRTPEFHATTSFFRNVLKLSTEHAEPDFAVLCLPDGSKVEVLGPADRDHRYFTTGPVVGFMVDSVEKAGARLEAAGIHFIGPVQRSDNGDSWTHFTGPDGNVYELTEAAPHA